MHVQEKQAWFVLAVGAVTLAVGLALLAVFGFNPGVFACLGIFGFAGLAGLIGRRQRKAGMVIMDERDKQIALNATTGAYSVFWVLFVFTAMGPFMILGPQATLTLKTTTICNVVFPAMVVVFVVRSLIVVVLYRRGCRA